MIESVMIQYECAKCDQETRCYYGSRDIEVSEIYSQLESKLCPICRGGLLEPIHIRCRLKEPDTVEKEDVFFRWVCTKCGGSWHSTQAFHPDVIDRCAKIMKTLADLEQITCPYGCVAVPNLISFMSRGEQQYVD